MLCRETKEAAASRQMRRRSHNFCSDRSAHGVTGQHEPVWPHHLFAVVAHALILIPTEAHVHPVIQKIREVCDVEVQAVELERLCRLQHIQVHGALSCVRHVCLSLVTKEVAFFEEICDFVQLWHEIGVGS